MKYGMRRFGLIGLVALVIAGVMIGAAPNRIAGSAALTPTPSFIPTSIPAGTLNTVWTPVERDFDGVTMVLVPAGCFMMGSTDAQIDDAVESTRKYFPNAWRGWFDAETPVHRVCFEQAFWIDKYEVSQAQFSQMNGTAGEKPRFTGGNLPVEMITWFESESFCEARGAHLPTEAEWEYAARGPEGWLYPWGNDFVAGNVVYDGNSNDQTAPVGSRPDGISWVGAHDLSGNVWEWIADRYDETYYVRSPQNDPQGPDSGGRHVLRGGGWDSVESFLRAPHRTGYYPAPGAIIANLGFRCARPAYEQLN